MDIHVAPTVAIINIVVGVVVGVVVVGGGFFIMVWLLLFV